MYSSQKSRDSRLLAGSVITLAAFFACQDNAVEEQGSVEQDLIAERQLAAKPVAWQQEVQQHSSLACNRQAKTNHVKILAINDFHGQLPAGKTIKSSTASRPVGSAPVLASYINNARKGIEDETLFVHAGDQVGASPPESALLHDEPTIMFMSLFGNEHCKRLPGAVWPLSLDPYAVAQQAMPRFSDKCNLVGTLGNHEFDDGVDELLRLIRGGDSAAGSSFVSPYPGTGFPYVSANVVSSATGKPLLNPYVIVNVNKSRIAFIGAILKGAAGIISASATKGIEFKDEVASINKYIPEIQRQGVHAIVVLLHQGGTQTAYAGATDSSATAVAAPIAEIVSRLDGDVDIVLSAHSHSFTNSLVPNSAGKPVLVTQAYSAGTAYADLDIEISRDTHDIVAKKASVVTTWADEGNGLIADPAAAALTAKATALVAPIAGRIIGTAAAAVTRDDAAGTGETALGNLVADSQRDALGVEIAFMNPGGIRADIAAGTVSWGQLFAVEPFWNNLVTFKISGANIILALEQQWINQPKTRILQISGISYSWSASQPAGSKISNVTVGGKPIDPNASYTAVANAFLAGGGDGFAAFTSATDSVTGPIDLDVLVDYVASLNQPFSSSIEGRITKVE